MRLATSRELLFMEKVFQTISRYEMAVRDLGDVEVVRIADDLVASMNRLLPLSGRGLVLNQAQNQRFKIFRNQLFSPGDYRGLNHKIDILLVRLIASYFRLVAARQIDVNEFATKFLSQVETLKTLEGYYSKKLAVDVRKRALTLLQSHKNSSALKSLSTEELYLFGCTYENLKL